jgi:hypothetical protein
MPRTLRSITPRLFFVLLGAVTAASSMAGCVDPASDYDNWYSRTADARAAAQSIDASTTFDGAPPDGGFTQVFAMACSTQIQPGFADATRFTATATYTPSAGGGGQLTFQDWPLQAHAANLTQTVGNQTPAQTVPVASDGSATLVFGPSTIAGGANPVTGQDVQFDSTAALKFIVSQDSLCAGLVGNIINPFTIKLDPTRGDVCVFFPSTAGADFPAVTDSAFTSSPCHAIPPLP